MSRRQSRRRRTRSISGRPHPEVQAAIVADARAMYPHHFDTADYGGCVGFTACTIVAAERHGVKLTAVAGSSEWRCVAPEFDPGHGMTHFGYEFEGFKHPAVMGAIMEGRLPELHCWATDIGRRHVVDVTTCFLIEQSIRTSGGQNRPWAAAKPPDYLWRKASKMVRRGDNIYYKADEQATLFVIANFIAPAIEAIKAGEKFEPSPLMIIPQM